MKSTTVPDRPKLPPRAKEGEPGVMIPRPRCRMFPIQLHVVIGVSRGCFSFCPSLTKEKRWDRARDCVQNKGVELGRVVNVEARAGPVKVPATGKPREGEVPFSSVTGDDGLGLGRLKMTAWEAVSMGQKGWHGLNATNQANRDHVQGKGS